MMVSCLAVTVRNESTAACRSVMSCCIPLTAVLASFNAWAMLVWVRGLAHPATARVSRNPRRTKEERMACEEKDDGRNRKMTPSAIRGDSVAHDRAPALRIHDARDADRADRRRDAAHARRAALCGAPRRGRRPIGG